MSGQGELAAQTVVGIGRVVFSLMFPFILITACGVSWAFFYVFRIPQFGLLWYLADQAIVYATTQIWAAAALAVFALISLPLAWVSLREMAVKVSSIIGAWVTAIIVSGFSLWLATVWPPTFSPSQLIIFALLLFISWSGVCEALVGTLKLVLQFRPQPGREVVERQKAHGDARVAGQAEAIALLNSKK